MSAAVQRKTGLMALMPPVRGALIADAPLARMTWFGTGGCAEVLFRPADRDDLAAFLAGLDADIPVTVLGAGSNLLVRDGGVPGVVVHLGKPFATIAFDGCTAMAGAGALDISLAMAAARQGIAGLEFLRGIPGTIGGALRMNAGAYGREIADVLISAEAVDRQGCIHEIAAGDMGFSYRHSAVAEEWIFTSARLRGQPGDRQEIRAALERINAEREAAQPVGTRTGGSTFKNPPGGKAWQLIDAAGCRGMRLGGAQVSEQHCNFLINTGTATARDLEALGERVRARVLEHSGIALEWEIRRIGIEADNSEGERQ